MRRMEHLFNVVLRYPLHWNVGKGTNQRQNWQCSYYGQYASHVIAGWASNMCLGGLSIILNGAACFKGKLKNCWMNVSEWQLKLGFEGSIFETSFPLPKSNSKRSGPNTPVLYTVAIFARVADSLRCTKTLLTLFRWDEPKPKQVIMPWYREVKWMEVDEVQSKLGVRRICISYCTFEDCFCLCVNRCIKRVRSVIWCIYVMRQIWSLTIL